MKPRRLLSVLLAGILQVMPLVRAMLPLETAGLAPSTWAFVLKVAGVTAALLGSYDAVSGATSIVKPYTVDAQVGTPYNRQLTTSGQTAHSWSANTAPLGSSVFPLTPGLWLTNSNGRIGGTPTVAMTTNITISAWENGGNRGASISAVFTFTVTNAVVSATPPSITTQPQSQTVYVGSSATFTVGASGTPPLSYQWRFNGAPISSATSSSYTRSNLQQNDAGNYSVVVTNSGGSATSGNAVLTVLIPTADIAVRCSGPANVSPGTSFNYTVTVTNLGPSAASNVVVSDSLPAAATFSSASGGGVANSGVVTWPTISSLASGATASYTVTVTAPSSGSLLNSASATSATADPSLSNNDGTASGSRVSTTVAVQADVVTTCTGPPSVPAGATFEYIVVVTNAGPSAANNVMVMDALPPMATFVSATGGGVYGGGAVTWPAINVLTAGETTNFTVSVTAPAGGSLTNIASSTSSVADPVPGNNDGSAGGAKVVTGVGAQADLAVFKTGPSVILASSNLTYAITVTNLGPSQATNIVVTDYLPPNVSYVNSSGGGSLSGGVLSWPAVSTLASGGTQSYTLTVKAPTGGSFTNLATATSATTDPNPSNNNGSSTNSRVVTSVAAAQGQFSISAGAIVLNPQTGLFEQSVNVVNTGPVTAAAARLYVEGLRSGVQLYNASGTDAGRPYAQYNSALNPNQSVTLLLQFYVPDRGSFTGTFQATAVLPPRVESVSGGLVISRAFTDTRSGSPRFVIEFSTVPGETYTIIYSDNGMASWRAATPSVIAASTVTQWYDDGPPVTLSKPLSNGNRFYRVISGPVSSE